MPKINLFNSMILFKKIVYCNCKKYLVIHLYKYTIVSKNKFIFDIRSFYDSLIAFFGLILEEVFEHV